MAHQAFIGPDGKAWPSATELTHLLPQAWVMSWYKASVKRNGWRGWLRNLAQSNRGQRIGTEVHDLLESFINHTPPPPVSGKYDSQAYADALYDKVKPLVEDWISTEAHLVNTEYRVHGTTDMIVRLNHRTGLWIGDWKTSAAKDPLSHPVQLAIYSLGWNEAHPGQAIDQGFIARVDKKSKGLNVKIDEYQGLKAYYPIVRALREIWGYVNKPKVAAVEEL